MGKKLEATRKELTSAFKRLPTDEEWSQACNLTKPQIDLYIGNNIFVKSLKIIPFTSFPFKIYPSKPGIA